MKLLTTGFSNLASNCLDGLVEPHPYKLSRAIFERSIIVENSELLRRNLKRIWDSCRDGSNPSMRTFIEMILSTPRSKRIDIPIDLAIANQVGMDLYECFLGFETNEAYSNLVNPILQGFSRNDIFESKLLPFVKTASSITLYDRYFCGQLLVDNNKKSGAYWLLGELINSGVEDLRIISASFSQGTRISREDLYKFLDSGEFDFDRIKIEIQLGFVNHDRHIRFSYPASSNEICLTLGKGAEIFQHEILKENFAIAEIDASIALANEKSIKDRALWSARNF